MFDLSDKDKRTLLYIAKQSIINHLNNIPPEVELNEDIGSNLQTPCGAFVSTYVDNQLRGCIGRFNDRSPLYAIIPNLSISAAFHDNRFPSVHKDELDLLSIEISVLTPMKIIESIDDFILGKHGIYIEKDAHSGTLLPQVAAKTNWTKEEFLGHCAQDKAGIGWNGWKHAKLYTYEAIIFSSPIQ